MSIYTDLIHIIWLHHRPDPLIFRGLLLLVYLNLFICLKSVNNFRLNRCRSLLVPHSTYALYFQNIYVVCSYIFIESLSPSSSRLYSLELKPDCFNRASYPNKSFIGPKENLSACLISVISEIQNSESLPQSSFSALTLQ